MKSLLLKLCFSVSFISLSFLAYSRAAPALLEDLEKAFYELTDSLERGDIEAYHKRGKKIGSKGMRRIFRRFVDGNGDNMLHFIVRLEQLESLRQEQNLNRLLVEETWRSFFTVQPLEFLRLLTKKNRKGNSPIEEASLFALRGKVEEDTLSPDKKAGILRFLSTSPLPPGEGLAYKAIRIVTGEVVWPWAIGRKGIRAALHISAGALVYSLDGGMIADMVLGAGSLVAGGGYCSQAFRGYNDLQMVRQYIPPPGPSKASSAVH